MDGNGCFPSRVTTSLDLSTTTVAWSRDYKKIAVGGFNNEILIFDANSIIKSCLDYKRDGKVRCKPVLLKKYTVPSEIESNAVKFVSWSPDDTQLVVETSYYNKNNTLHILILSGDGAWKTIARRDDYFRVDWSPRENLLITAGGYFLDAEGNSLGDLNNIIVGESFAWSPDGTKLAAVIPTSKEVYFSIEHAGIAILDYKEKTWTWAYKPLPRDTHYWPSHNLAVGSMNPSYLDLSWSPDSRYLAFVARYGTTEAENIFRLDTRTGDIVILAKNISGAVPAWGP